VPTSAAPKCAYCKENPQAERAFIASACRTCARALMRVLMAQNGRDPNTGKPMKVADPLAWVARGGGSS